MKVNSLSLKNFRNIKEINLEFDKGMNVICGENAQGKTNIIESLWLFTGAKSFRTSKDNLFVQIGKEKASCELKFVSEGIEKEALIEISEKRKA